MEIDDRFYAAFMPAEDNFELGFYVKEIIDENGEEFFVNIKDKNEFMRILDIFNKEILAELDELDEIEMKKSTPKYTSNIDDEPEQGEHWAFTVLKAVLGIIGFIFKIIWEGFKAALDNIGKF